MIQGGNFSKFSNNENQIRPLVVLNYPRMFCAEVRPAAARRCACIIYIYNFYKQNQVYFEQVGKTMKIGKLQDLHSPKRVIFQHFRSIFIGSMKGDLCVFSQLE